MSIQRIKDLLDKSLLFLEMARRGYLPSSSVAFNARYMSMDIASSCVGCDLDDEIALDVLATLNALSSAQDRRADLDSIINRIKEYTAGTWGEELSIKQELSIDVFHSIIRLEGICDQGIRPLFLVYYAMTVLTNNNPSGIDIPSICEGSRYQKTTVNKVISDLIYMGIVNSVSLPGERFLRFKIVPMSDWSFNRIDSLLDVALARHRSAGSDDPLATFAEWASDADRRAYAGL